MSRYKCNPCNFDTDRLFNYNTHLKSPRHQKNAENVDRQKLSVDRLSLSGDRQKVSTICEYCKKKFTRRTNLIKHHGVCKEKTRTELELSQQVSLIETEKLKGVIATITDTCNQLIDEKIQLQTEIIDQSRKTHDEFMEYLRYSNGNSNDTESVRYNIYYVMNNCKNALDYDKLMDPVLTIEEKRFMKDESAIVGCYKLLTSRCIEQVEFHQKPFHLLDGSRKKYYVKVKGIWTVDMGGELLMQYMTIIAQSIYLKVDADTTAEERMIGTTKFKEFMDNKHKILSFISDQVLISNNSNHIPKITSKPKKIKNKKQSIEYNEYSFISSDE
jgi:hypothetical protein